MSEEKLYVTAAERAELIEALEFPTKWRDKGLPTEQVVERATDGHEAAQVVDEYLLPVISRILTARIAAALARIVETLTAHEFVPWHGDRDTITAPHCSCDALWSDGPESDELDWHRAHLARALLSSHDVADSPSDECSLHVWTRTQQEREDGKPFWCHECGVSEPDANRLPWPARAARQHRNCNCDECDEERSI